jgi:hypothetical protein
MSEDQVVVPGEAPGEAPVVATPAAAGPSSGHHDDEIHMPPNSWWPLIASVGATVTMLGLVISMVILVVGAIILVVGVGGWIRDARKEYQELH